MYLLWSYLFWINCRINFESLNHTQIQENPYSAVAVIDIFYNIIQELPRLRKSNSRMKNGEKLPVTDLNHLGSFRLYFEYGWWLWLVLRQCMSGKSGNDMMPLADHVYYVGIVSKNLTSFAMTWVCIQ